MTASDAPEVPGAEPLTAGSAVTDLHQFPATARSSSRSDRYVPSTPWTPWKGTGATLLIGLAVVVFLFAVGGVLTALHPEAFERLPGATPRPRFDIPMVAYGFSALMLTSQLFGVVLTLVFARAKGGRLADVLALRAPLPGPIAYLWAIPAFVVFGFAVGTLVQWLWPQSSQADTQLMLQLTHSPASWLIFTAAVVMAPLQEELIFRGFLFSALARSRWLGFIGATLLTSLGWAAIHGYSITGDATIFLLGLLLSFILWRTGSTRVTMACHGCYNALAFVAAMFAGSGGG